MSSRSLLQTYLKCVFRPFCPRARPEGRGRDFSPGERSLREEPQTMSSSTMSCEPAGGPTFGTGSWAAPYWGRLLGNTEKGAQMIGNTSGGVRILGSLGSVDGFGIVRMEDRFDTDIDDVWSA